VAVTRYQLFITHNDAEGYRGLAHHGGLPSWLEERDPAGVILSVMDGPYRLPFPYRSGCPTGAAHSW
jgi:hypothetical protein